MPPVDCNIPLGEFEVLVDSIPSLRVMTISPHLEAGRGYERIKALVERGVVPALGHDRIASEAEILGALSCSKEGRMHITHLFNVCSFHHRYAIRMGKSRPYNRPNLISLNGPLETACCRFTHPGCMICFYGMAYIEGAAPKSIPYHAWLLLQAAQSGELWSL